MNARRLFAAVVVVAALPFLAATAEAVPPKITPICVGAASCTGWFTSDVHLRWVIDGGDVVSGCNETWITKDTGPAGLPHDCNAQEPIPPHDPATSRVTIFRDTTPPSITDIVPDRPPDHAGWYTRPVRFAPGAIDASSGVAACDPTSYSGPDAVNATITATCKDKAGNSASRVFPLSYDATPPDPSPATISTGDRVVRLAWPAGPSATVTRTPGLDGAPSSVIYQGGGSGFTDRDVRNRRRYSYVLTLTDQAGNAASRELSAKPVRKLLAPEHRATVAAPPLLTWTPVRDARYYNVQLFRDGRKVLSAWPKHASLQLKRKWRFRGKRRRLKPDEYHWHVWPGEGRRAANEYGERIGKRSFTVLPAAP